VVGHCPPATDAIAICATSDLLLKYPDEIFATYEADETLERCAWNMRV
jgi:hypothetical protein